MHVWDNFLKTTIIVQLFCRFCKRLLGIGFISGPLNMMQRRMQRKDIKEDDLKLKVGIVQLETFCFEKDRNEEKILSFIRKAREEHVDLVLFPEGANLGYIILDETRRHKQILNLALEMAPSLESPWIARLKEEARKGIHIACGHFLKADDTTLVNSLLLISPESRVTFYNKTHLYHEKTTKEADFVRMGNELVTADTSLGKIGLAICYDVNFPEVIRKLALDGARIILLSAAWPEIGGRSWDILLPARAFENGAYLMACNQAGKGYYGHSKIIDYMGNICAHFNKEEGMKTVEIDFEKQEKWRDIVTFFQDRRPDLYG
jgi:predicted amidohydrolase